MDHCGIRNTTVSNIVRTFHNNIPPEELYEKYAPMGFSHYKIEGRTLSSLELAGNYAYYMAKPEHHDELILALCEHLNDFDTKMFN